jgi:glutamine amidotransferase
MAVRVGIVDYQMGNLRSVQKAVERIGGSVIVSSDVSELQNVSHLILPGVGAFGDAMAELKRRDLVPFLRAWAQAERPFLGICLGMQLLFDSSEEGALHEGLSILPGKVVRFDQSQITEHIKIPHMGWNRVASTYSDDSMLSGIEGDPYVYFVHSYYVQPANDDVIWLTADYGRPFCAAVRKGNTLATQFHPEKSQKDGLQLLANFLKIPSSN